MPCGERDGRQVRRRIAQEAFLSDGRICNARLPKPIWIGKYCKRAMRHLAVAR